MTRNRILTLIMAGGAGSRMAPLTTARAKPALPFGGVYRLIDFPLSHCVHSELTNVWVIEQFQAHTINEYLLNGRPWDLDRNYGGLRLMQPQTGTAETGWHQGNADAIYRNQRFIQEFAPDTLLVVSADHIYKLDYRAVIAAHHEHAAAVTLVTTRVPRAQAARFGNVQTTATGKITRFDYKPEAATSDTVTAEVFVYDTARLMDVIAELVDQQQRAGADQPMLKDFGDELLPAFVTQGQAYAVPLTGYWRDVGTISSYWLGHMDMLKSRPPLDLDEPGWPILTAGTQRMPARIGGTARIDASLIAPGCVVHGTVERSVLGPGVVVAAGATVRDAVIFENTVIERDASVERAIIDRDVRVAATAQVGAPGRVTEEGDALDAEIAVVGQRTRVTARKPVPPGARIEPTS
jgi:glucose-1-phosphate adenylyltransferase